MTTERQIQDRVNETQADSLGIEDTQQSSINKPSEGQTKSLKSTPKSATNIDPQDDSEHLQQLDLLTKKLRDRLNSIDTVEIDRG